MAVCRHPVAAHIGDVVRTVKAWPLVPTQVGVQVRGKISLLAQSKNIGYRRKNSLQKLTMLKNLTVEKFMAFLLESFVQRAIQRCSEIHAGAQKTSKKSSSIEIRKRTTLLHKFYINFESITGIPLQWNH